MSDEHELNIARREAEQIASSEAYFAARHWSNDSFQSRKVFEAGFERAWESQRARHAALEAEKSDMLKAMQDARRALAYAQKYDTVMEISYLKLDAAICAVKPAKEG